MPSRALLLTLKPPIVPITSLILKKFIPKNHRSDHTKIKAVTAGLNF